jgi:hypothetical protein
MQQKTKYEPYTRCGCKSCRLGQNRGWGRFILQSSKRKVRHQTRQTLNLISNLGLNDALDKSLDIDFGIVSAGYTD